MVDFKRMRDRKAKAPSINPREIFNSLPKPPGINDLYASQAEVLDGWNGRRSESDIIVKLHTGGGKTLVGLLMSQSIMNETGDPVLYLAPTRQLVDQVIAMSREYGIPTVPYKPGQDLPPEFLDGRAVLVGTYNALFNGRSKFGVRGGSRAPTNVAAIILDDAHVALTSVRDTFTLNIDARENREVYKEIADRFRSTFGQIRRLGAFRDVVEGKDDGVLEVPSWAWLEALTDIQGYLSGVVDKVDKFVWPFLRDRLHVCHCLIRRTGISITPVFPAVDLVPTFKDAPRRIYMSATIADDSEIIRAFDTPKKAVESPISSNSLTGVGERMILIPQLMKQLNAGIIPLVQEIVAAAPQNGRSVVILTPSNKRAETWSSVARIGSNPEEVGNLVKSMQSGQSLGPIALANRYDGIDFANNACRILVMDESPQGTSNYDVFRQHVMAGAAVDTLLAQRIEQGLGRGTRGGSDYCVAIIVGSSLVSWIGRKKNLDQLTVSTRTQLKIGQEITEEVQGIDALKEVMEQCLTRNRDWVEYHADELADAVHEKPLDELSLEIAAIERKAHFDQLLGQYDKALGRLNGLLQKDAIKSDKQWVGWLSAACARLAFQMNDGELGQRYMTKAYEANNNHSPPRIRPTFVPRAAPSSQAKRIVSSLGQYEHRSAVLASFEDATSNLVREASANRYEEALRNLGEFLGFDASRPDNEVGKGPDVLWRMPGTFDFIIEAKNEKEVDGELKKRDHAQLLEAEQWFKEQFPERECVRVSAVPTSYANEQATTHGTYALTIDDIAQIQSQLRILLRELIDGPTNATALTEKCNSALDHHNLTPTKIRTKFLKIFQVRN